MKSLISKFLSSAFALVLGIGMSFGVEQGMFLRTGYYNDPFMGVTEVKVPCEDQIQTQCQFNGHPVFQNPELTIPLKKSFQ